MKISKLPYYQKKTNPQASFWGDLLIVMILPIQSLIAGAPNLTPTQTYWGAVLAGLLLIMVRFWLKSFKIETSE